MLKIGDDNMCPMLAVAETDSFRCVVKARDTVYVKVSERMWFSEITPVIS